MLELIVNPIAGKGKSLKNLEHAEKVFKERGVEYRVQGVDELSDGSGGVHHYRLELV